MWSGQDVRIQLEAVSSRVLIPPRVAQFGPAIQLGANVICSTDRFFSNKISALKPAKKGCAPFKTTHRAKAIYYWLECASLAPGIPNFGFVSRAFFIVDSGT
jgi:hypothetical protein